MITSWGEQQLLYSRINLFRERERDREIERDNGRDREIERERDNGRDREIERALGAASESIMFIYTSG